jgi:hypothetical protein
MVMGHAGSETKKCYAGEDQEGWTETETENCDKMFYTEKDSQL